MYKPNRLYLTDLTVEHRLSPLGIDCREPRFAWKMHSGGHNVRQAAYQLRLYRDLEPVADTGKVESSDSIEVTVPGFSAEPKAAYRVAITVWDNKGRSASLDGTFETGLLGTPFRSSWVEPEQEPTPSSMEGDRGGEELNTAAIKRDKHGSRTFEEFRPAQFIRIPFTIPEAASRARVYMTAHGVYHLYVNGVRPDDRELAPENTAYNFILFYQTYDITGLLRKGENVLGVVLSDGWWVGRVGTTGDCCQYGDTTGLLLDGEITCVDGSTVYVSGEQGHSAPGPIIFSDLFVGEKYDATKEFPGWSQPGFDASGWTAVHPKDYPKDNLLGQITPPVRPVRVFRPERIFTAPNGDTILDAGQVLAGNTGLKLCTRTGHTIKLEHFEVLDPEGNYFNSILNVNKEQTDIYVTKDGFQTWRPAFTYHGFRYVRVTGWPEDVPLSTENFCIFVLATEMDDIGHFETSDEHLNQLQSNIRWSQISNTLSIPTDCPQREKAGWTGDIMAFAPTLCFNQGADAFLTSWMASVRAEQLPGGAIPMIVPYLRAYREFIGKNIGAETSCGWGDAVILVPYALYRAYGDRRVLEENYAAMEGWLAYIDGRAKNCHPEGYETWDEARKARSRWLWNTDFHFGDWLIPSIVLGNPNGAAMNDTAYATMGTVAPAYYAFSAKNMAEISAILGKQERATYYGELYQKIRRAFIDEYVHTDGTMDADFQGIYVIALRMGLVDEDARQKMVRHLCEMIESNGNRLDTGFLSVLFLMDVLCDNGRADMAYRLLWQDACPSWLYEVKMGATTMWESWGAVAEDGSVSTYSYNHYAFGCISDWMYRRIGGLQIMEPGYRRFRVAPDFGCGLSSAKVSEETPYGKAAVEWRVVNGTAMVHVTVPVNTEAEIVLLGRLTETVGSGSYDFLVKL